MAWFLDGAKKMADLNSSLKKMESKLGSKAKESHLQVRELNPISIRALVLFKSNKLYTERRIPNRPH